MPPVADLKSSSEPTYPEAALTDPAAEAAWWNEVLIWGRGEHGKVQRICRWADTLGREYKQQLPKGWCE